MSYDYIRNGFSSANTAKLIRLYRLQSVLCLPFADSLIKVEQSHKVLFEVLDLRDDDFRHMFFVDYILVMVNIVDALLNIQCRPEID